MPFCMLAVQSNPHIVLDQLELDGWCGQYLEDKLYFQDFPVSGWVVLGAQVYRVTGPADMSRIPCVMPATLKGWLGVKEA